jgi:hypothetical protein
MPDDDTTIQGAFLPVQHAGAPESPPHKAVPDAREVAKAAAACRKNWRWYAGLWIAAMLLASAFYAYYCSTLPAGRQSPFFELLAPAQHHAAQCARGAVECKVEAIKQQLHAIQTPREALAKTLIVVALSMLWFRTFMLQHAITQRACLDLPGGGAAAPWWMRHSTWANRLIMALSILPAAIFALSMVEAYEPAVFAMALAAIYVAAEHYCGLQKTEERLDQGVAGLNTGVDNVKSAAGRLESGVQLLDTGVRDLMDNVGTLLNADGMERWRLALYTEYCKAGRSVDAVVRYFDIDREWWLCDANQDVWSQYKRSAAQSHEATRFLLKVMTDERNTARFQFVADLPMPVPKGTHGESPTQAAIRATYFRNLLGLAWQLTVFNEANQVRDTLRSAHGAGARGPGRIEVMISSAPAWMHVIDEQTYQAVERKTLAQSCFRLLHRDVTTTEAVRVSDWARRNIVQFAARGTPAGEYVIATLRHTALARGGEDPDSAELETILHNVLRDLGLRTYLNTRENIDFVIVDEPGHSADDDAPVQLRFADAETLCVAVFKAFLRSAFPHATPPLRVRDLAGGLL